MINTNFSKEFLDKYLSLLEELIENSEKMSNAKYLAQLRNAERSFNFFFDVICFETQFQIPPREELNSIKQRRDKVADIISNKIESDDKLKKGYESYCENLKNPRTISSFL